MSGRPPFGPGPGDAGGPWPEPADAVSAEADLGDWAPLIEGWRRSDPGARLLARLAQRRAEGATIYPSRPLRAFCLTPLAEVRVVILGQDPYHGAGQAEGLAFSVPPGLPRPPSLRNLDVELQRDLGLPPPDHGHLGAWARQGVLLLNTVLTVEDGQPGVHAGWGWEALTEAAIGATARDAQPKAYLLWGRPAQRFASQIEAEGQGRHLILEANHPSPLSARRPPMPFIGCGHFGRAAAWLHAAGRGVIDWRR